MVERQAHQDDMNADLKPRNTLAIAGGLSSFYSWRDRNHILSMEVTDTFRHEGRECLITRQSAWHNPLTDTYGIMVSLVDIDTKETFVIHFNGQ